MRIGLKIGFLLCLDLLVSCSLPKQNKIEILQENQRPNILFIMTDDHTKQAMSAYSNHLIETPNIDRIANEGIRFDQSFVTNSICGPSRAVMLTGKYSHINGFTDNHSEFDTKQVTFPKLLQASGYETALVGKWHLKNRPVGFDYYNILPEQGYYYNPVFIEQGDTVEYEGYVTDITTDLAIQNLENRDLNKPFCLLVHQKAPHRNWMPDTKHLSLFENKEFPLPTNFFDNYENRTMSSHQPDMRVADMFLSMDMKLQPNYYDKETGSGGNHRHNAPQDWDRMYQRFTPEQKNIWDAHYDKINHDFKNNKLEGEDLAKWKYQRYIKDYLKCVVSVDENVGRLLDYLETNNLSDNTIVIYTSDQGFYLGEHGWFDKRFMYEESFSMPLAIKYPKAIPSGKATDAMALNLDFAPTILDYAGIVIPSDIQGQSLRPICEGLQPPNWRQSVYYHYYQSFGWHQVPKHYGIRTPQYKLINYYESQNWELYNLTEDPNEMNNIIEQDEYQSIIQTLKDELDMLRKDLLVE